MQSLLNTLRLTVKELRAIRGDKVMLALIFYVFTAATWLVSDASSTDISDLSVAVVDEDHSPLSYRLTDAIRGPLFAPPPVISPGQAKQGQTDGDYVLVVSIPPHFQRDLSAGKDVSLMILIDATAVAQAGNGASYMQQVLADELAKFTSPGAQSEDLVQVVMRNRFNPNLTSKWFSSVMQLMNSVTILTLILAGSSLIREREHGTIEHVLVMPVRPHEIVFSKILATGIVILASSVASLFLVVQWGMGVPVAGSPLLYTCGAAIYVVAVGSLGLLLASFTQNMGQFGLLVIPVIIVMFLLSGGITPMESMPGWLRLVMKTLSPSPHYVEFAQSVLYRGSGLALVAGNLVAMALMALVSLVIVIGRFRKVLAN
ncbi:ABC transporter permease [Pseudodonghicola flavimaris]|uniref:ABC transporter permease n=1 Tax=Pseudodonghicola flavimaris TaxID=3050036 RepID=A0ABT7F6C9_9RHOB|nr:ABC transporter permease [Pseudodonghicola flavimaris]MDK3020163.1 ABC transporter permease [Pseudodonghicola flavimaris]